jgi:hypothetical protein
LCIVPSLLFAPAECRADPHKAARRKAKSVPWSDARIVISLLLTMAGRFICFPRHGVKQPDPRLRQRASSLRAPREIAGPPDHLREADF